MEVAQELLNRWSYAVRTLPPALNSDLKVEGTLEHHSLCHCKAWDIWTSLHGSKGLEEHGGALANGVQWWRGLVGSHHIGSMLPWFDYWCHVMFFFPYIHCSKMKAEARKHFDRHWQPFRKERISLRVESSMAFLHLDFTDIDNLWKHRLRRMQETFNLSKVDQAQEI